MPTSVASGRGLGDIHATIQAYYDQKLQRYGATPLGVDWTCLATQELRFVHLLKLCDFSTAFSLNDLGCGYGALVAYLTKYHSQAEVDYLGVDLSAAMVRRAKRLHQRQGIVRFINGSVSPGIADYSVASGIFNVKLHHSLVSWERFVRGTLVDMDATSRRGFAVNFMAPVPRGQSSPVELYRTTPDAWTSYCQEKLGCSVEVLENYGMREFTLLARPERLAYRHRRPRPLAHP